MALNALDKLVAYFSPSLAHRRALQRDRLNFYEAGKKTHERKWRSDRGSGDMAVAQAGDSLRIQARHLEQNHDLAKGVLDTLVNNTVGPGIRYEPQVKRQDGELHDEFNEQLLDWFERWAKKPDVTREMSLSEMERLVARTWFRDGEAFKVYYEGVNPSLRHPTPVLLAIDAFEPDYVPFELNDSHQGIVQGVRKNGWGRPTHYYLHKHHPGDPGWYLNTGDYSRVSANYVNHIKLTTRLKQTRGVSTFAVVMNRLDDLKDFEESERIAARIAARMVAYIKKGTPDMFDPDGDEERQTYEKGMTFYDMMPGEEIGTIDTSRPNSGLESFRSGQLKAAAAGVGTGYSSIARDYNGSYAAQRQELVEQQINYAVLKDYFIKHSAVPDYERFVRMAELGGLDIPFDVDRKTLSDVECSGTPLPWVDPLKEVKADAEAVANGFTSRSQIIRKRGGNPSAVLKQIARDNRDAEKHNLVFVGDAQPDQMPEPEDNDA